MDQIHSSQLKSISGGFGLPNVPRERALIGAAIILAGVILIAVVAAVPITTSTLLLLVLLSVGIAFGGALIATSAAGGSIQLNNLVLSASALLTALMCATTLVAQTQTEFAVANAFGLTSVIMLWTAALPTARSRRGLGPVPIGTLISVSVLLVVLLSGWSSRIGEDAHGLSLAAVVPLLGIVLTRYSVQIAIIPALLTISFGVYAVNPTEQFARWVVITGSLMLAYVVVQARFDPFQRSGTSNRDVILALGTGVGFFVISLFTLNEPIRSLLLGLSAFAVLQVIVIQRQLIKERDDRVLELAKINDHVERIANLDHLTGLPNRAALSSRLAEEVERSVRYRHPMSVCFVDIDHFKLVNDSLGHAIGDRVLQQIAAVIRSTIRTPDFVARFGGEEFVVIAPGTWTADAVILGDRIQCAIAEQVEQPFGRPVTVSIGIAGVPEHGTEASSVLERADLALYAAKFGGRNRIDIANTDESSDPT